MLFSPFLYNWIWEVDRIIRLELKPHFFPSQDESSFQEAVESDHLVIFRASKNTRTASNPICDSQSSLSVPPRRYNRVELG